MNFHIMTLFPELIDAGMNTSIIGRAVGAGLIKYEAVNIRDFSAESHRKVDDYPYGGGAGMVMQAQPIYDCWKDIVSRIPANADIKTLYMSPAGKVFNQEMAEKLAQEAHLIILCGHYEGVDQRALELTGALEVSIGDYVLSGGELAALVVTDAVSRMCPGVLSNSDSGEYESFSVYRPGEENFTKRQRAEAYSGLSRDNPGGEKLTGKAENLQSKEGPILTKYGKFSEDAKIRLLEYPQYTRPEVFMGKKVPEVLLSGNHAEIEVWRRKQSVEKTLKFRPDIIGLS